MTRLTNAQRETLAVMDTSAMGYSLAAVAHKRRQRFDRFVSTDRQHGVLCRMRDLGLVVPVPQLGGDMWAPAPAQPDTDKE